MSGLICIVNDQTGLKILFFSLSVCYIRDLLVIIRSKAKIDLTLFYYFLVLSTSGTIKEWGECMPDCPKEDVTAVCVMEPGDNLKISKFCFTPNMSKYLKSV